MGINNVGSATEEQSVASHSNFARISERSTAISQAAAALAQYGWRHSEHIRESDTPSCKKKNFLFTLK